MRFGIAGLGAMGGGMAEALLRAGHEVWGYDPDPEAQARARSAGVATQNTLKRVLEDVEVLVICVATLAALEETYDQLLASDAATPGLVIETSTIAPERARHWAAKVRGAGRVHVEAAMIGLPPDAAAGNLFLLVGGAEADVDRAHPYLDAASRGFVHLGDTGSGAVAKVLNNAIGGATMLVFTEAILTAKRAGLDPQAFIRAVIDANGAGNSVVFKRHAHWVTSETPQPPTPLNVKDMAEMAVMLGALGGRSPMMEAAIASFDTLPTEVGLVQGYARRLGDRD